MLQVPLFRRKNIRTYTFHLDKFHISHAAQLVEKLVLQPHYAELISREFSPTSGAIFYTLGVIGLAAACKEQPGKLGITAATI